MGRPSDNRASFASDIAFEATDDFDLAHSFRSSSSHVFLGPRIVTQPDHEGVSAEYLTVRLPQPGEDDGFWVLSLGQWLEVVREVGMAHVPTRRLSSLRREDMLCFDSDDEAVHIAEKCSA